MPKMLMICGPNGAGKSTIRQTVGLDDEMPVIDPDRLARENGLSPIAAGKAAANLARNYIASGTSFARESTMTARFDAELVGLAKGRGFEVELIYIGLDSPEFAVARVAERVANGGHDVPQEDIKRRYRRGLNNLGTMLAKADRGLVYDNTEGGYQSVMEVKKGLVQVKEGARFPSWLSDALGVSASVVASSDLRTLAHIISESVGKAVRKKLSL